MPLPSFPRRRVFTRAGLGATVEFVCECSDTACASTVELKVAEYERIRTNSTWFLVRTDHDIPEIERVVSQDDGYAVVEKFVATDFAREADPRSDGPS